MVSIENTIERLARIPNLQVLPGVPLARYTRFAIGGPADVYAETPDREAFATAWRAARAAELDCIAIGNGTNLVAADEGFRGVVLRFTGRGIEAHGDTVAAEAGAELQAVVDAVIAHGLKGLETLAGIPGSLGAAVYGNAGAYGRSMSEAVHDVVFFDGECVRAIAKADCAFRYRESVFKRNKNWIVLEARLALERGDAVELRRAADEIMSTRNAKFPPEMKCAGSIFKNLILAELPPAVAAQVPERVVREGKVAAAFFLEQAGMKGAARGCMRVADYHANLVYNAGGGTARELRELIAAMKARVRERFGLELEEEVQYIGF